MVGMRTNSIIERMVRNIPARQHMIRLAIRRGWPHQMQKLIDICHDDELDLLGDRMIDAEFSGDWSALISEAKHYPAWRS